MISPFWYKYTKYYRHSKVNLTLVEDALESAILSRMLEKPRDEIEGKFDRAFRFCRKLNNDRQWIRLHYQRTWTYLNWYNDYSLFISEYTELKNVVLKSDNIYDIELYFNLYNLLYGISVLVKLKDDYQIDISKERDDLISILNKFEADTEKPNSSLISKTYKILLELTDNIKGKININPQLKSLIEVIKVSDGLIDYPFVSIKEIIEEYWKVNC